MPKTHKTKTHKKKNKNKNRGKPKTKNSSNSSLPPLPPPPSYESLSPPQSPPPPPQYPPPQSPPPYNRAIRLPSHTSLQPPAPLYTGSLREYLITQGFIPRRQENRGRTKKRRKSQIKRTRK